MMTNCTVADLAPSEAVTRPAPPAVEGAPTSHRLLADPIPTTPAPDADPFDAWVIVTTTLGERRLVRRDALRAAVRAWW